MYGDQNLDNIILDIRKRISDLRAHLEKNEPSKDIVNVDHENPPIQIIDEAEEKKKEQAKKKLAELSAMKAKLLGKKK